MGDNSSTCAIDMLGPWCSLERWVGGLESFFWVWSLLVVSYVSETFFSQLLSIVIDVLHMVRLEVWGRKKFVFPWQVEILGMSTVFNRQRCHPSKTAVEIIDSHKKWRSVGRIEPVKNWSSRRKKSEFCSGKVPEADPFSSNCQASIDGRPVGWQLLSFLPSYLLCGSALFCHRPTELKWRLLFFDMVSPFHHHCSCCLVVDHL